MNSNDDKMIKAQIKQELDQTLFENVQLAPELIQRIQMQASNEKMQSSSKRAKSKRWIPLAGATTVVAASIALLLLLQPPILMPDHQDLTNEVLNASELESYTPMHAEDDLGQVNTGVDDNSAPSLFIDREERALLHSIDEAKELFGDHLLLPAYIPVDFELEQIHSKGSIDDHASTWISLTYMRDKDFLKIIQAQSPSILAKPQHAEQITLEQTDAYWHMTKTDNDQPLTELMWEWNDVQYIIQSSLSVDEAIQIANSLGKQ